MEKAIESLARVNTATSMIPKTELIDVLKALVSKTNNPFIPGIEVENGMVKLSETAIFKKDKLIGWLNGNETRGLLWILGKVKGGIIVVKSPK